ncbi:MAG TPA: NADH:flavin oxidoreductase/NADH oxidase [Xanthobacteraceae bacterium]|nr:NADH:flavin oxidoreductase/NADH oxidase [Xanthobacteraceae bacterium]
MTSSLFSPIKLAGLELPNRIVVSPMCQYSADDGCANDWHLTHLGMLANSGAGLVIIEATHVERFGRITHGCLGIYSDANEAALARVIAHCKRIGTSKFGVQLAHSGRKGSSQRPWEGGRGLKRNGGDEPWETMAPSAVPFGTDWPAPREMDTKDFDRVRDAFINAARRAVRIGFDAIELHMAHGYLLHSIATPIANKRTDEFGAGRQAGWRYLFQLVESVRAAMPRDVPLGARITGSDWVEGGLTPDDAVAFARGLRDAGMDYVDISSGGATADIRTPTTPGYNVPIAEKVKHEAGIATRVVGMITGPRQADAIVSDGRADMVALGRAMLDDPHWAWEAARQLGGEVERPPQYARVARKLWPVEAPRS